MLPAVGDSDGSASDGITSSIHGSSAKPPYLAASNARSMPSTSRARRIRPVIAADFSAPCSASTPAKRGRAETTKSIAASVPCARMFCSRETTSGSR